ncbi:MAG: GNAT family N-acetyltransferase, partial [Rhodospirillaceae bacterium]|nr:GNAT family N-acetyltransferase [Rhodospirillaceae bacterium]
MSTPVSAAEQPELREAGPLDLAALAALHAACFAEHWDAAALAALLAGPGCCAVLALLADRPVGFVMLRTAGGEAEILSIGVDPAFRRRRIGMRLLEAACARAARAGAESLYLEVAEDDSGARRFYGAAGFE